MLGEIKYYITTIYITEPNIDGDFLGQDYEYKVKTEKEFTNDDFNNTIFQAMEIERIYDGKLLVTIQREVVKKSMQEDKCPEYITTDEVVINVKASLTKNRSKYIDWDKCGSVLPPIYEIDRENSTIEAEY